MNNLTAYPVFLLIELARIANVIDSELEYDETWRIGCDLFDKFSNSEFNKPNEPQYECIEKFISEYKQDLFMFKILEDGGVEIKKSKTLIEGYELVPTIEEKVERLKGLYDVEEVAEIIGFFDETNPDLDFVKLTYLYENDIKSWSEAIYKEGANNGNFEEAILRNERFAL